MVSVLSQPSSLMLEEPQTTIEINEQGNVRDAVESFTKLVNRSHNAVRLHCTVPTWSHPSDTCLDLHDLNELRSRSLLIIHSLLESLRSCGIVASYRLTPSDSSLCIVSASRPETSISQVNATTTDIVRHTKPNKRKTVWLVERGPSLIIT